MHDCANPAAVLVANSFLCVQMRERSRLRLGFTFCAGECAILHLVGSSYCSLALSAQAVISQGHLNACEK